MKPKEIAKLINALVNVGKVYYGKSDVADDAKLEIKRLIKLIPELSKIKEK
jgi:hypothetical protein